MNRNNNKFASYEEQLVPTSLWLDGTQAHLTMGPCSKKIIRTLIAGVRYARIHQQPEVHEVVFLSADKSPRGSVRIARNSVAGAVTMLAPNATLVLWREQSDGTRRKACERPVLEYPSPAVKPAIPERPTPSPVRVDHEAQERFLQVANDGPSIISSNYWDTSAARAGKFLVSVNAGHARLLIPECMESELPDMVCGATRIEVEALDRAEWRADRHCIDWAFVDGTDQPYVLQSGPNSIFCGIVPQGDLPGRSASLWVRRKGQPHRYAEFPLSWRTVRALPGGTPIR
jgi:hypothetical protein